MVKRGILRKINSQSSVIRTEKIGILLDKPKGIHVGLEAEAKNGFKSTLTGDEQRVPGDFSFWIWQKLLKESTDFQETDNTRMMEFGLWGKQSGIGRRWPDCVRSWRFAIPSEDTYTLHLDSLISCRTLGIICEENPLQVILNPSIEVTPSPGGESSPAESLVQTEEFGEGEDLDMYDMDPNFFVLDGIEENEALEHEERNSLQYVLGDWMGDGEIADVSSDDEEGF